MGTAAKRLGRARADVGARTKITVATLGLEEFKKRNNAEAEKFFTDYKAKYGTSDPDPYAIYGYETMKLALDTLKAVGDKANDRKAVGDKANDREAVRAQLLENTKDRESALGVYSIDENGDTTLTDYGLYTIQDGVPSFEKVIKAQAG